MGDRACVLSLQGLERPVRGPSESVNTWGASRDQSRGTHRYPHETGFQKLVPKADRQDFRENEPGSVKDDPGNGR